MKLNHNINDLSITRILMGLIFIWYGTLKVFSGLSPAEELAILTIDKLFFSIIPANISIKLLAVWELAIGVGFLLGKFTKQISILFLIHMVLTFTPLFLLPDLCFTQAPFAFTLVGQYIVKNLIFIMVGVMIYKNELTRTCVTEITE